MNTDSTANFEIDWLNRWAMYSPEKSALTCAQSQKTLSYKDFYEQACVGAEYLKNEFKIKPNDRVLLLSTNEISTFVLFFSLARLGATLVPINYRLTSTEITFLVTDSAPDLIVYEDTYTEQIKDLNSPIKKIKLAGENSFYENCLYKKNIEKKYFLSTPESIALIIYTSGTTGFPKGAMISHRALFWNSINTTLRLNISDDDAAVIFLPLFHTGGWNVLSTPLFHRGGHIILMKKFEADDVLHLSEKFNCTLLFGVPTTMAMMSLTENFKTVNLKNVRYAIVGGEPMPISEIEKWHSKNIPIRQGYGLTEFGPNVFSLNESDSIRKKGSIGFPNFYVDVCVMDECGKLCPPETIGELWLKGPMVMSGYWNNNVATAETMHNGWLKTGDLVRYDSENYFYVVGRKKEMFKSGGENVYPAEIEKVLMQHPTLREAAVVGVADEQWGEVGHAYVSLKAGADFNEAQLRQFLMSHLAKFKNPKYVTVMKDLPKGDSGKILKRQLIAD